MWEAELEFDAVASFVIERGAIVIVSWRVPAKIWDVEEVIEEAQNIASKVRLSVEHGIGGHIAVKRLQSAAECAIKDGVVLKLGNWGCGPSSSRKAPVAPEAK